MSFKCDVCNEPQPAGKCPVRLATETRMKSYFNTGSEGTFGWEIVREKNVCSDCAPGVRDAGKERRDEFKPHLDGAGELKVGLGVLADGANG